MKLKKTKRNLFILFIWTLGLIAGISGTITYNLYTELTDEKVVIVVDAAVASYESNTAVVATVAGDGYKSEELPVPQLIESYDWEDDIALAIAQSESRLNPDTTSNTDLTQEGLPYSIGLFQINLTVHDIGGLDCPSAFKGKNNASTIIDYELYNSCVKTAKNAEINVEKAYSIYKKGGWTKWGAYTNGAYLNF